MWIRNRDIRIEDKLRKGGHIVGGCKNLYMTQKYAHDHERCERIVGLGISANDRGTFAV